MSVRKTIVLLGWLVLAPLAGAVDEGRGPPPGAAERWAAHDTDGDGAISLAEAQAGAPRLAANFARFDTDQDGRVTREEMHAVRAATREERRAEAEERYRSADTNGDGTISAEEAQAGMPRAAKHFGAIDADGDGQLTREEMRTAMRSHRAERRHEGAGGGQHHRQPPPGQ